MSFLKSSISIMRCDFKSRSCSSGVLWYSGFAIVGELGSDGAMLPCFPLVMFLRLPFAIWLSLVLTGATVSDYGLSVMQASVSVLLGDLFSLCILVCKYFCETHCLVVVFGYVARGPDQLWVQAIFSMPLGGYLASCATWR